MLKLDQQLSARKEFVKTRRKNFLPTLAFTFVLLVSSFLFIFLLDPNTYFVIPLFLVILFLTLFCLFSLIFADKNFGALFALVILISLLLRLLGLKLEITGLALLGFSSLIIFLKTRKS